MALDRGDLSLVNVVASSVAKRAIDTKGGYTIWPATVLDYDIGTFTTWLSVDGDEDAAVSIEAKNITGHTLIIGTRVMCAFYPPNGVVVVGFISRYSNKGAVEVLVTNPSSYSFEKELVPDFVALKVECVGGGGGGGGSSTVGASAASAGAGGGGGAYCASILTYDELPDVASYSVGAGGTGGAAEDGNGGNGGTTNFGSLVVAPAGAGGDGGVAGGAGTTPAASIPGAGAAATAGGGVGTVKIDGSDGGWGRVIQGDGLGTGCGGRAGGYGGKAPRGEINAAGQGGTSGSGGAGAGSGAGNPGRAGGTGGNGYIRFTFYY